MTDKEIVTVVREHMCGYDIEFRYLDETDWQPTISPQWNFEERAYRIKPQSPLKPLEIYVNVYDEEDGDDEVSAFPTLREADDCLCVGGRTALFREVKS